MINEPKEIKGINDFSEQLKEVPILRNFENPKPLTETMQRTDYLFCEPPEVILQNVEKNKMYEIPIKIYNISKKMKRINIKRPKGLFKIDTDKKNKQSEIAPGMHLEVLVIFETDQEILEDQFDQLVVISENDFKLVVPLKAYLPQPLVQYEPLINLGFVPVGTKKMDTIQFLNDGSQSTRIELKLESKNDELTLDKDVIELPRYNEKVPEEKRKKYVTITYQPTESQNLHEKINVKQITGDNQKDLGFIEIISTSVIQQMSLVFDEGGGPQTDINFGLLYHGQNKECCAFLVNNGPKEMTYKFFFHPNKSRRDFNENYEDENLVYSPEEAGLEMTQRILSAFPEQGNIKAYSQIPIKFLCNTKIKKNDKGWKATFCPEYDINNKNNPKNLRDKLSKTEHFQSLAAVKFEEAFINKLEIKDNEEDFCKPISVYMEVKAILPDITIDKTMINFWECNLKEKKVITITLVNKNDELPVDFCFNKIPHFTVEPDKGILKPCIGNIENKFNVNIFFHPENIGKFNDSFILKYVNNLYEIPIKVFGICKGVSKFNALIKNNEKLNNRYFDFAKNNFQEAKNVPDDLALDFTKKPFKRIDISSRLQRFHNNRLKEILQKVNSLKENNTLKRHSSMEKIDTGTKEIINAFEEKFNFYAYNYEKKNNANLELIKMRQARKLLKPIAGNHSSLNIDMKNKNRSVDQLLDLPGNRLESPKLKLPDARDKLWVIKPVGKYEPVYMEENENKSLGKTPEDMPDLKKLNSKNGTGEVPRTHQEIRECNFELSGEDLQKIQVGTKVLKFGQIFKNSEKSKTFWVKNNHRNYIFVKLDIDNTLPDLQRTIPKSHVIAPGEMQGFKITIFSNIVKNNIYPVRYIINNKYIFYLKVYAEITMVKLSIQNYLNKFAFRNDKIDKSRVEMTVTQKIKIFNGGNALAEIKWEENKEKAFKIIPMKDTIPSMIEKEALIIFNPFESTIQKEKYTDNLTLKIVNGDPVTFNVEGTVPPCHVSFADITDNTLFFEMVHTGVPSSKKFSLRNDSHRVVTAYKIENNYPNILKFNQQEGYITDKTKIIEVIITYKKPCPDFSANVKILIRGGKPLDLTIKANIVTPDVMILEDKFDFGGVSFNEPITKPLTFKNNSKLPANVYIDLNSDIRYKDFKLVLNNKNDKNHLIQPVIKEKKEEIDVEDEEELEEHSEENDENDDEKNVVDDIREFNVTIPPGESLIFDFIFCPVSFESNNLNFYTNFKLIGAGDDFKGLKRQIIGRKMDSMITISDMLVKFPKTFIYENEKNYKIKEIKIGNVQRNKTIKWEFILSNEFINDNIFKVLNKSGEIAADENFFTTIKFSFTPKEQKEYKSQVILHVTDSDKNEINKTIRLEGEGLLPRLYFDKRELILPIVPLGFESSIKFKVKNEGYVNEELRVEFETYPQGVLPLKFNFLENIHTIGYNKNELKCEVKLLSNKAITFTTKLFFIDTNNNKYSILVAGTTDNCLFTNYSFFQRNDRSIYEFKFDEETKNIFLKKSNNNDENNNEEENDKKTENNTSSFVGSSTAKNSIALLGYNKINPQIQEQNCKFLKKYIKRIHLDDQFLQMNIFKIFPDDVVKDNGKIVYIIIKNLIGKEPPGKIVNLENDLGARAIQIREQYCQLIRFLQECGASLNTVFPEYLMDFVLYKKYISLDKNRAKILAPKWEKSKSMPLQWRYFHKESWVLLIYQILKIFYLSRVNLKIYNLALKNVSPDIQKRYTFNKLPQSNVYSTPELILLKWVNACYDYININSPQKNVTTFSKDFADSSLLTALLLAYFPKEEKNIKKKLQNFSDVKMINYSTLINIFKDYGIYTHIKKMSNSPVPKNGREILLLLTMLFQNMQHFAPKDTITFTCILGDTVVKTITLMNPTNKLLEYSVKYDGSDCFEAPQNNDIKIEPNKEYEYSITFKSKFSAKVDGKIYFINRKLGWNSQAAPIVYYLISNITERRSIEYKIISTNLFSQFAYKLQVKTPFPKEKGEFQVFLEQKKKIIISKKKNKGKNIIIPKNNNTQLLYKVFNIKGEEDNTTTVKFNNNDGTAEIIILFLPVELETYECNVILLKENVGEFQYTIEGRVERPIPKKSETFEEICTIDEPKEFFLEINIENQYLKNAVEQLKPMENVYLGNKFVTNKLLMQKLIPTNEKMTFSVESSRTFFIVPSTIFPGSIEPPPDYKKNNNQKNNNIMWLKVKFLSKVCMVYEGDITIKNLDKPNDIRIYKLYVDVKPKDIKATLEFFCPMNETISQKIPIENKSDKDWIIKSELTGQHFGYFHVDKDKRIAKHAINDIILSFAPTEKNNCNALLKLINNYTGEKYFYTLVGNVEDPLAEGNIEINNINAKEIQKRLIQFENHLDKDIKYTVETDLDDVISGDPFFIIKAKSKFSYEIKISPLLGKIYFGRIIFRDENNGYKWYTIRIEAKSQIQPKLIEMKTEIRKSVFVEINLDNPTNETTTFIIDFEENLFLFGDKDVKVDAKSSVNYKLLFAPLKIGIWENVILHIYNDKVGEFLYKLKLICVEQPIKESEIIHAELGKYYDFSVMLENPTNDEVEVKYTNSKPRQFQILQEKIFIPPGINKEILVRYTPSCMDAIEECILKFETKKIGNWEYHLKGTGIPPTEMEVTYVRTYVGGVSSGQVNFKNPLNEKVLISIELKCENFPDTFCLFNKKNKYQLEPGGMLVIPFTFKPHILTKYSADLFVYIKKDLFWKYPIEGITEIKSKGTDFSFKTKSKKMFETKIALDLSNFPDDDIDFSDFGYVINIKEEKYSVLISKCLSISFDEKKIIDNKAKGIKEKKLPLNIKFYPLRPFKTDIEFILRKKSGGQWIYNIILESTEPDPDDILYIKSSLGKQSFIAFKLQNIFNKSVKFIAYFSHDSSSEFSVTPREGILESNGKEGTQFVVCYLPIEYGKVKIGKLIIETDEVEWIFEVRGTHIDYIPPEKRKK